MEPDRTTHATTRAGTRRIIIILPYSHLTRSRFPWQRYALKRGHGTLFP